MFEELAFGIGIAGSLILGLLLGKEVGFRLGRRAARRSESVSDTQIGAIQGAVLGLLGLLLGFSFAGSASRFFERQDIIVNEANTIGTAYLRADLLDEPYASRVRRVLEQYVQHRIEIANTLVKGLRPESAEQVREFHKQLWNAARDGVLAKPATMLPVLNPVNEVIDIHSTRVAAGLKHMPWPVLSLLIACSLLAMAVMGYAAGLSGDRRLPMNISLAVLIAAALWISIDLDHPRAGVIRISDAPLEQLNLHSSSRP